MDQRKKLFKANCKQTQKVAISSSCNDAFFRPPPLPVKGRRRLKQEGRQLGRDYSFRTLQVIQAFNTFYRSSKVQKKRNLQTLKDRLKCVNPLLCKNSFCKTASKENHPRMISFERETLFSAILETTYFYLKLL